MDQKCKIDEKAFYADLERFANAGLDPETCVCDYCLDPRACPHERM